MIEGFMSDFVNFSDQMVVRARSVPDDLEPKNNKS